MEIEINEMHKYIQTVINTIKEKLGGGWMVQLIRAQALNNRVPVRFPRGHMRW